MLRNAAEVGGLPLLEQPEKKLKIFFWDGILSKIGIVFCNRLKSFYAAPEIFILNQFYWVDSLDFNYKKIYPPPGKYV